MYERKIPVDLDCPLRLTMSLMDSKWKSCILDELRHGALRPSELHRNLPEATPRVLDLQLKELVEDGLVTKTIYAELPPRSEYALSELGATLLPIIDSMIEWGAAQRRVVRTQIRSAAVVRGCCYWGLPRGCQDGKWCFPSFFVPCDA